MSADAEDIASPDKASGNAPPPPPPPLFLAAQHGELQTLQTLLDGNDVSATYADDQGITALHWAAINNHLMACKTLLLKGADIDAVGGDLRATPMQWAARSGHVYVVHLLIQHGADPSLKDAQGFDTFHLATHSSSPLLLVYLLSQQLPVATDTRDGAGRTCLMWAAYQGDALSVELLINFGADPNVADPAGLTAAHWACVKGSVGCIAKVIESGADLWAKNAENQTPFDLAKQLNSVPAWNRAMASLGRENDGRLKSRPLNEKHTRIAIYVLPWPGLGLAFKTLDTLPWYTGMPLAFAVVFAMHHIVVRVLLDSNTAAAGGVHSPIQASPYLFGIVSASIFWVGYAWLTRLMAHTPGYAYTNFFFALALAATSYNLFRSATLDPGYIPKSQSDAQLKDVVDSLTSQGLLNGQNFCLDCLVRRPVRSKHDRIQKRCIGRYDHACPWINNAVGVGNHRQFVTFVATLIIGVILFVRLCWMYFSENAPEPLPVSESSCIFPSVSLCSSSGFDTFAFSIACWASLQLTWTFIVLGGQLWQISRQLTTYELSNLGRYGYMGGKGQSLASQQSHAAHRSHASNDAAPSLGESGADGAEDGAAGHRHGPECRHGRHHSHAHARSVKGLLSRALPAALLSVVGLDLYTKGKAADGMARVQKDESGAANPFDVGLRRNCLDFWSRGRTLGVDYTDLYEVPPGGYRAVLQARQAAGAAGKVGDGGPDSSKSRRRSGGYSMVPTRPSQDV